MSSRSTIFVALLLGSLLAAPVVDAQKHKRRKPKAEPSAQSEAAQPEPVPAPAAEPTEGPAAPADAQVAGAPAPASASGATAAAASDAGSEAESGPDLEARVRVDNQAAETQSLVKFSLLLDGAPVHRAEGVTRGERIQQVFDGYAAPGPHVLTVEAEQRSKENDKYRYTTRDTFRFEVIRGKTSVVTVVLEDDSGIAEDFPDDEEGEYEVTTRVRVETRGP